MRKLFTIGLLFFLIPAIGSTAMVKENLDQFVMCRLGKTIRTIRVGKNSEAEGCVTTYTKNGQDREVGSGRNWQSCTDILENIKTNLENASWKCREIEKASISSKISPADNEEP
jgi:hypothetical protein